MAASDSDVRNVKLKLRNDRKALSKSLTPIPHSNIPLNRDSRPWKNGIGPLSKIINGRIDYDLLRQEALENGITWPPNRNNLTSPIYSFFCQLEKRSRTIIGFSVCIVMQSR